MATHDGKKIIVLGAEKYPSNSYKSKSPDEGSVVERPKAKKVAVARRVKKPFLKRFSDTFLEGGTGKDVVDYIVHDVIIPASKSTVADLIEGAIDMVLFGEEGGRRGRRRGSGVVRDRGRSYVSYSDMYEGSTRTGRDGRPPVRRPHDVEPARATLDRRGVESISLGSRAEAELVLGELVEMMNEYQVVSLADLYEMVGFSSSFPDTKYGWYEFESVCRTERTRDGWALVLPRPVAIES